jgi:hypothetical protein
MGLKGNRCFVLGGKNKASGFGITSGTVYLFDLVLENLELIQTMAPGPFSGLHLRNVDIHGGTWEQVLLEGGQWENVRIYPEIQVRNTTLGELRMHKVSFPEGSPWRGKEEIRLSPVYSASPFDWPEVHVPTPEELGLSRKLEELPAVSGAPQS